MPAPGEGPLYAAILVPPALVIRGISQHLRRANLLTEAVIRAPRVQGDVAVVLAHRDLLRPRLVHLELVLEGLLADIRHRRVEVVEYLRSKIRIGDSRI